MNASPLTKPFEPDAPLGVGGRPAPALNALAGAGLSLSI